MPLHEKLDYSCADSIGYVPAEHMDIVGRTYRHYKNGKLYQVLGFVWSGENDRWVISHFQSDGEFALLLDAIPMFVRTPENFFEKVDGALENTWTYRFTQVLDSPVDKLLEIAPRPSHFK